MDGQYCWNILSSQQTLAAIKTCSVDESLVI